jgi:hypothetical protein
MVNVCSGDEEWHNRHITLSFYGNEISYWEYNKKKSHIRSFSTSKYVFPLSFLHPLCSRILHTNV